MTLDTSISVVLPTFRAVEHLLCCARSLVREADPAGLEVCIYGDGGGEASREAIAQAAESLRAAGIGVRATYAPVNLGNTRAVNAAAALASGAWLLFANDDMVFPRGWRERVVPLLRPGRVLSLTCAEPPVGGHRPASCFVARDLGLDPERLDLAALDELDAALSAPTLEEGANYPFLIERSLFRAVGGADERFAAGPYHDPDLFLRLKLGGAELVRTRAALLYHFSGISLRFGESERRASASRDWVRSENRARLEFIRKWGAKPHAPFGRVPATRADAPWDARPRRLPERARRAAILAVERLRAALREARRAR